MDEKRQTFHLVLETQRISGADTCLRVRFDALEDRDQPAHCLGARHRVPDELGEDVNLLLKGHRLPGGFLVGAGGVHQDLGPDRLHPFDFGILRLSERRRVVGGRSDWGSIQCKLSPGQRDQPGRDVERLGDLLVGCERVRLEVPFYQCPSSGFASHLFFAFPRD